MIMITGDTHGNVGRFSDCFLREFKNSTDANNYLIVCGDFGFVFNQNPSKEEENALKFISNQLGKGHLLVCPGNHENWARLNSDEFDSLNIFGGKAKSIAPNIHLMQRGEVYSLPDDHGKITTVFNFGGAFSHDRIYRKEGINLWSNPGEELPTEQEMNHAWDVLNTFDNRVDLIITHQAPYNLMPYIGTNYVDPKERPFLDFLNSIAQNATFSKWYFGHVHLDQAFTESFQSCFRNNYLFDKKDYG